MVVINVKKTEADQFLYECSIRDPNDKAIRELVSHTTLSVSVHPDLAFRLVDVSITLVCHVQCFIWNTRERIGHLASACEELAKHGRMKREDARGIDEVRAAPRAKAHRLYPGTVEYVRRTCVLILFADSRERRQSDR